MDGILNAAQATTAGDAAGQGGEGAARAVAAPQESEKNAKGEAGQQDGGIGGSDYVKQLRAEFEKEKADAVKSALEEAEKKAAMKPDEVKEYEGQKREAELEKREKELRMRELKNDTKDILHEKDIPAGFAEFLMGDGLEKTKENINTFKVAFDLAVQAQVEHRLKGTTPKAGSGVGAAASSMASEIDKYL